MHNVLAFFLVIFFSLIACGKPIVDKADIRDQTIQSHERPIIDYKVARTYLFGELHYNNGVVTDVYCNNKYTAVHGVGKGKIPNPKFLNCEHTWPQSKFGLTDVDKKKNDLHHLFPVESNSNSIRSNNPFGDVKNSFNVCHDSYKGLIIGTNLTGFEPPERHKGNVARAVFYFSIRYNMQLDIVQETYLRKWHKNDPVDSFESTRNKRIEEIQGNTNPFIDDPSLVETISDF
jgi:deoxyribonuclease-1